MASIFQVLWAFIVNIGGMTNVSMSKFDWHVHCQMCEDEKYLQTDSFAQGVLDLGLVPNNDDSYRKQ